MARGKRNDNKYFVVRIGLDCTDLDIKILNKRFEITRHMYNKTLAHAIKRLSLFKKDRKYKELIEFYHILDSKISKIKDEDELKILNKEFNK